MTLVGYPDFQEQAQWQSPPAVIYSAALANGATKIFPATGNNLFNVSNWAATQMRIFGQFAALDVECQWYDADPATALLGHRYWTTTSNGSDSNVTLPNAGPYLRVNVTNLSGVAPTLVAVIAFTNRITAPFTCPSADPVVAHAVSSIGGGVTTLDQPLYLYAGSATLSANTDSNEGWIVLLSAVNSAGTANDFCWIGDRKANPPTEITAGVTLPPRPVQLRIFNLGAAAHFFSASVIPDSFR